jgi:hypothetical protein
MLNRGIWLNIENRSKKNAEVRCAFAVAGVVPRNGAVVPTLHANFPGTPTGAQRKVANSFSAGIHSTAERLNSLMADRKPGAFSDPGDDHAWTCSEHRPPFNSLISCILKHPLCT